MYQSKFIIQSLLVILISLGMYSCKSTLTDSPISPISQDKKDNQDQDDQDDPTPKQPTDESNDHGHEMWSKVEFQFRLGHLHGVSFHGNPIGDEGFIKYQKRLQTIKFEYDSEGNITKPKEPLRLIKGEYYALEIVYYDKNGKRMNSEFTSKEMAKIHQHFFLTKNAKKLNTNDDFDKADNILGYTYRDTNPEDKQYKSGGILSKDPIGLKGYFKVKETMVSFDLNVLLVHIVNGDKYKSDGSTYPFNAPSKSFLGTQDLNLKIPVRVYASRPEGGTDEDFNNYMKEIAKEFNITPKEAEEDWERAVSLPFGKSNYYM